MYALVKIMNIVCVVGGFLLGLVFLVTIWTKDGTVLEQPIIWQSIATYTVILVLAGIVRRAAALERLMRPRVKDNGLSAPDGYAAD